MVQMLQQSVSTVTKNGFFKNGCCQCPEVVRVISVIALIFPIFSAVLCTLKIIFINGSEWIHIAKVLILVASFSIYFFKPDDCY